MPLTAGTRLGPYEILSPIGAGGTGIKVLPSGKVAWVKSGTRMISASA